MSDNDGYVGLQQPTSATDEFNAQQFVIRQLLNGRNYCALVKVVAVNAPLGLNLAGTVDVQPLVNQLDGAGKAIPHGVVNDLLYFRAQGGVNAVIMDPAIGDIGICVFADRDSSAVQATKKAANPGSKRRNDMADGLYLGGVLNAIPTQYILFEAARIRIHSPTKIRLDAPVIEIVAPTITMDASTGMSITTPTLTINGNTQQTGTITASGNVTTPNVIFAGGKSLAAHTHGGVQTGGGSTGGPN